jgi:hypothetical protein
MRNQRRLMDRHRNEAWDRLTKTGELTINEEVREPEQVKGEVHFPIKNICSCSICGHTFSYETCPNLELASKRMNMARARAIQHWFKCQKQNQARATAVKHQVDVTNTCFKCGNDYADADVEIIDGVGAVCRNCASKKKEGVR